MAYLDLPFLFVNLMKLINEMNGVFFNAWMELMDGNRQGVKVSVIGQRWRFPKSLQDAIDKVEDATKNGKKPTHYIPSVLWGKVGHGGSCSNHSQEGHD